MSINTLGNIPSLRANPVILAPKINPVSSGTGSSPSPVSPKSPVILAPRIDPGNSGGVSSPVSSPNPVILQPKINPVDNLQPKTKINPVYNSYSSIGKASIGDVNSNTGIEGITA